MPEATPLGSFDDFHAQHPYLEDREAIAAYTQELTAHREANGIAPFRSAPVILDLGHEAIKSAGPKGVEGATWQKQL